MSASPAPAAEPAFTVHYQNNVWDGRPMAEPCTCRHPGMMGFPIGMTIERKPRGGNVICVEADICMDCGSDRTGQVDLIDGLTMAYREATERLAVPFLWRTYELVEHRRADLEGRLLPIWMAAPLGLTRDEINDGLLRARLQRAVEYMAARLARYAKAA